MPSPARSAPAVCHPPPSNTTSLQPPRQTRTAHRSSSGRTTPTTGSATQTITATTPRNSESPEPPLVLRLRGAHNSPSTQTQTNGEEESSRRGIRWAEDVVDNEGLGRKSSKVCCIYHKPRAVGESDSESDSSDSDSDASGSESADDGAAKPVGGRKGRECGHGHDHSHGGKGSGKGKGKRKPSPNAYERLPKQMRDTQGKAEGT